MGGWVGGLWVQRRLGQALGRAGRLWAERRRLPGLPAARPADLRRLLRLRGPTRAL
jgi:hypothetical protein